MIISFSVENFRSIRDLQTLSFAEMRHDDHLECGNVFEAGKRRLVKTTAIFGPNASGKSNFLGAMRWFRGFVLNSAREGQTGDTIDVVPFLLATATEKAPTHFEIEFFWKEYEYRYGFRVNSQEVLDEWLFRKQPGSKAAKLFTREGSVFDVSDDFFKEGKGLEERTRGNALFLSVCAQLNGPEATNVMEWMRRFRSVSGLHDNQVVGFTARRLEDAGHRERLLELARRADFNISALRSEVEEFTKETLPEGAPDRVRQQVGKSGKVIRSEIMTGHEKRDHEGNVVGRVEFNLKVDESQGTQKFIALSGPITHTLEEGSILVVDEFEARLHPRLTQAILDIFHSPANQRNAQLICATHDVTLLDPERFRRDQVWFCEKDETGATSLYSLAEFDPKDVRATTKFSRQYMMGLFGAVPKIGNFQEAAEKLINHE